MSFRELLSRLFYRNSRVRLELAEFILCLYALCVARVHIRMQQPISQDAREVLPIYWHKHRLHDYSEVLSLLLAVRRQLQQVKTVSSPPELSEGKKVLLRLCFHLPDSASRTFKSAMLTSTRRA